MIFLWGHAAKSAAGRYVRTELDWFTLGVVVGFIGGWVDNLYWGLAWLANYLALESEAFLFGHGSYSNVIFRQGFGIVAALCHVQAGLIAERRIMKWISWTCVGAFTLSLVALPIIKIAL